MKTLDLILFFTKLLIRHGNLPVYVDSDGTIGPLEENEIGFAEASDFLKVPKRIDIGGPL